MADILSFETTPDPMQYYLDVTVHPDNLAFTISRIKTDSQSLLKIAAELEKIASIIRSDVIVGKN